MLLRTGGTARVFPGVDMDRLADKMIPPAESMWGRVRPDGDAPWSVLSEPEQSVLDKMRAAGTPLAEWDVRINNGIKTGYNDAFILDDETRKTLIDADPKSAEIIKPILRGRDIQRYRALWAGKWLIATHNGYGDVPGIDVNSYPAVKEHLDQFYPHLEKRQDKGGTPYNLRNCAYYKEFSREKLFWMQMSGSGRFAYADEGYTANQKTFMVTGWSLKFLCGILNSSLSSWFMKNTGVTTGMGLVQWDKFSVERIPIPKIAAEEQCPFVALVDRILAAKDASPAADTSHLESEIDRLVYDLYGLTGAEVAAVVEG